jgi:hypothetical protein
MISNSNIPISYDYRKTSQTIYNYSKLHQFCDIFATSCMYNLLFMCAVFTTKPIKSILLEGLAKEIIIINLRFRPRY